MNNNIFLELKESDAFDNRTSGSWVTTLQEKIIIEENDEIVLTKSMIDTNTVNQLDVNIDKDLTLEFEFLYYTTKQDVANKDYPPDFKPGFEGNGVVESGRDFVLLERTNTGSGTIARLETIEYTQHTWLPEASVGGLTVRVNSTDAGGNPQYTNVNLPLKKANHKSEKFYVNTNIIFDEAQSLTFTKLDPEGSKNTKIEPGAIVTETNQLYTPYTTRLNIPLKSGIYSPLELCKVINRELQTAKVTRANTLLESPILTQSDNVKFNDGGTEYSYYTKIDESGNVFNPTEPSKFFRQDTNANYWVGASLCELSFNTDSSKFFWNYTHTPAFDADGAEAILYQDTFAVTKQGGILFQSLTAYDENEKGVDFFSGVLGFDLNDLLVNVRNSTMRNVDDTADIASISFVFAKNGKQMTAGFVSPDTGVAKKISSSGTIVTQTYIVPIPTASAQFQSSIQNTQTIVAREAFENRSFNFSHFLVSINGGYSTNLIAPENNYRMINSIVSKYYTASGYTYGSEADSISYVHQGEPIVLSSFECRILNPNKAISSGIGNDSTLYLNIIKSPQDTE